MPAAPATNCAEDVQVVPSRSVALAVTVVRAPAGRPRSETVTGRSSSSERADTVIVTRPGATGPDALGE